MKIIKTIVGNICDELDGAEHYAKLATQYKDQDRSLADVYAKMADVKLGHVNTLHEQAVRLIKEQKAAGVETPPAMQAVWDYEHENQIDKVAKIKTLLSLYRGS